MDSAALHERCTNMQHITPCSPSSWPIGTSEWHVKFLMALQERESPNPFKEAAQMVRGNIEPTATL